MIKRTLIWNTKGGVGKTALAVHIARIAGAFVIANESHSDLPHLLGEDQCLALRHDQPLPNIPPEVPLVYDFGGFAEPRVIQAALDAHYVIVPVCLETLESMQELQGAMGTIRAIEPHNKNIIIVNTKSKPGHMAKVMEVFKEARVKYPILDVKYSTVFSKSITMNKSIDEIIEEMPLQKRNFSIPNLQLKTLIRRISQ